ncbi:MAG: hypothetical protein DMD41_14630 [Gemmatimonadetes bacterium]|nr:MAG: hypothetical protein DMD41_14630 [Gemmatimonadota bacterium]
MPWYAAGAELLARSRAHWKSFALFLLIGGVAGGLTALLRHPVYRSGAAFRAEPRVDWQGSNVAVWVQPNAQFLADLLRSDTVLRRVASGTFPTNEHFTIGQLRGAINVSVNYRTWVVSFSVDARTPPLAQALAESTLAALTAANAALRQSRADTERALYADRAAHARDELRAAEHALAANGHSAPRQRQADQLKRAVDIAQQVYVQLLLEGELAALQEARSAPVVAVIDSPQLPAHPDRPRRRTAVLVGLLIGAAVALVQLVLQAPSAAPAYRTARAESPC